MIRKLKKFSKRKVFWTFLFSYLAVILLPMGVLAYSFQHTLSLVEQQLEISDRLVLEQFFSGIDAQLLTAMKVSDHIAFDTATSYFCNRDDLKGKIKSAYAYENIKHLLLQLTNINTVNENIKECYIYYSYSDRVLTSNGIYDSDFYFKQRLSKQYDSRQQWIKSISDIIDAGFICIQSKIEDLSQKSQSILYVRRVQWYRTQPPVYVVMEFGNSILNQQSSVIELKEGSSIAILNSELNKLYASDPEFIFPYQHVTEENYGWFITDDDKKLRISWIRSKATGCIYFLTIPESLYSSKLVFTRTANLIMILTTLTVGILVSLLLASKRYQPIRALREFAGKIVDNNSYTFFEEDFSYIRDVIKKLADEKQIVEKRLKSQSNIMRNSVIERLLYINFPKVLPDEDRLAAMNISFDSTDFAVAIFRTKYTSALNRKSFTSIKSLLSMENFWNEVLGKWYNVYLTQIDDDNNVILINFHGGGYTEQKKLLKDTMDFCHKMITEKFNISLSLYVSDVQHTFAGIHKAFRDALFLSEFYHKTGDAVFAWEELPDSRFNLYYSYKPETEQKLINFVTAGKTDDAKKLILKVHEENIKNLPPWFEKVVIMDLLSSCLKSINMVHSEECGSFSDIQTKMRHLLHDYPEKYSINDVLDVLELICNAASCTNYSSKSMSIEERVRAIIREKYDSSDLNVSLIAQYLDINPSYVSALYKKCANESILDSINLYRLNKAENLLINTSKDIKDIAAMVGYYNSAGFIRAFKKYKGITPGQFRNMHNPMNLNTLS